MQSAKSECETLNADFRISAEIDKESELALGNPLCFRDRAKRHKLVRVTQIDECQK